MLTLLYTLFLLALHRIIKNRRDFYIVILLLGYHLLYVCCVNLLAKINVVVGPFRGPILTYIIEESFMEKRKPTSIKLQCVFKPKGYNIVNAGLEDRQGSHGYVV